MQTRASIHIFSSPGTSDSESQEPNVLALTTATKKCVDFVSDLPWEIVKYNLVPRLLGEHRPIVRLNQPYPYLDVCSTWTKRIILADDSIHFILHVGHPLSEHYRMRLRMVAPRITSLALLESGASNIPGLLKYGAFPSLTKLTIEVTCSQEALLQLLEITPNLTHLDMTFYDHPQAAPFSPFDVLDRCPQLLRLHIYLHPNATIDMTPPASQHDRTYDNITHLQATCEHEDRRDAFEPLIKHLPNLRLLYLAYPPSTTSLNAIHQHCPKLQQLYLSFTHVPYEVHDDGINEDAIPGLKLLSLDGGFYHGDYIPETMIRHSATLESLVLKNGVLLWIPDVDRFMNHHDLEFKQLKSLILEDKSDPSCIKLIEWVIQHAPNLQSIYAVNITDYGNILSSTLRQRPLKRIVLHRTPDQQDVYQFLQHHVQLDAGSQLQEINCILHSVDDRHSWIFLIPKLTQLKTLELCFASENLMDELKTFIHQVSKGCIALEKVVVKSIIFPSSSEWIRLLANHRNLQELIIESRDIPDDLINELEAFPHLKRLHLKYHIKDWDSVRQLKHKIPNLVYTDKSSAIE